jgi:hypothetical protein
MRRALVLIPLLLAVLMGISAPFLARAEPSPFCSDETPPKVDQAFASLATVVGEGVGAPIECAHVEQATGDLQQATAGGLFYLRKSTNTATFTDGAEHWAVRGAQSLHWTTSEADPPSTAETRTLASAGSQPAGTAVAPVKSAIAIPIDAGGTTLAIAVVAVGLVLCVGVALLLQRQRARAYPRAGTSAQLVAARAAGTAGGLTTGLAPFAPSVSVGELQSAITDIGRNRVTEQADVVLRADPEAMIWQGSPSALAILLPPLLKGLVVFVIAVMIRAWVASLIAGSASSSMVQWVLPAIALLGTLWAVACHDEIPRDSSTPRDNLGRLWPDHSHPRTVRAA